MFNNNVFNEFEKLSSNFLLLLFVSSGFRIEENLLKKIQLEKSEFNSLSLKSTFVITNLIESKAFEQIKLFQVDVVELLKKRINEISVK